MKRRKQSEDNTILIEEGKHFIRRFILTKPSADSIICYYHEADGVVFEDGQVMLFLRTLRQGRYMAMYRNVEQLLVARPSYTLHWLDEE
jgi:hypothetical protein